MPIQEDESLQQMIPMKKRALAAKKIVVEGRSPLVLNSMKQKLASNFRPLPKQYIVDGVLNQL
jgi:hypothetical protein